MITERHTSAVIFSDWSSRSTRSRCHTIGQVAAKIAAKSSVLVQQCRSDCRVDPVETITGELFPLCAALKWIGGHGEKVLRPRRAGYWGRPLWLRGVHSEVRRVAHGRVLILAAWNYPLLLPGVQIAQALAAGNEVLIKPAVGCESATERLVESFHQAGVPAEAIVQIDSSTEAAVDSIERGVDLVVLTGASETGTKVLSQLAETTTPAIMELSGCDAVVVHPEADLDRVAKAITFGLTFNASATCMAPRRIIADSPTAERLLPLLGQTLGSTDPLAIHPAALSNAVRIIQSAIDAGAIAVTGDFDAERALSQSAIRPTVLDQVQPDFEIAAADLFAPVASILRVASIDDCIPMINHCRYRLSASIFAPEPAAQRLAESLSVGTVVINDVMVPTADPRLPFGGRGNSGFGVTRGEEGLLAMTTPKTTTRRRGRWLPHLRPRSPRDRRLLEAALQLSHAGDWTTRIKALRQMIKPS